MCKETNHANKAPAEHQILHTMKVEQTLANLALEKFERLAPDYVEAAQYDAHEARLLADSSTTPECLAILELVEAGELAAASRLR